MDVLNFEELLLNTPPLCLFVLMNEIGEINYWEINKILLANAVLIDI